MYPCIHKLLVIGCTFPITSCEAEGSFSSLRLTIKPNVLNGEERLAALTLMTVHSNIKVCPEQVIGNIYKIHAECLIFFTHFTCLFFHVFFLTFRKYFSLISVAS